MREVGSGAGRSQAPRSQAGLGQAALGQASSTGPPDFVGRDSEMVALEQALAGGPAVVLVEGEAGIGKSRLVQELLASPAGRQLRALVATCPPFREPYTLGPVVDAARQATTRIAGLPLSDLAGALRPLFPEWAAELPPAPEPLGDAWASRHRLFRALLELFGHLDTDVLVVEDVHWADEATLEFLLSCVARQPPPFSVVVTYRPEDVPAGSLLLRLSSRLPAGTTRLRLPVGPLDVPETAELVSSMLDAEHVSATFAEFLHRRTAGIPLVVEESVRLLRDRADVARLDGEWVRRSLDEIDVPPTVRDAVLERVERLGAHARAVLEATAVLAEPSDEAGVAVVSALTADEVASGMGDGLAAGLLRESGWRVSFRHPLASQAVYEAIPAPRRRTMHLRAGRALEGREPPPVARLAYHFREAGRTAEWCRYAERAADLALASSDETAAGTLIHELLTNADLPARSVVRLVTKIPFAAFAGRDRHTDLVGALRSLLVAGTLEPGEEVEVRFQLGCVLSVMGEHEASRVQLEQVVPLLAHDPAKAARAMAVLAFPQGTRSPAAVHLTWLRRAAAARTVMPAAEQLNLTVDMATVQLMLGEETGWDEAAQLPDDAATAAQRQAVVRGHLNIGNEAMAWGRYPEAARRLAKALDLAERHQYLRYRGWIRVTRLHLDWLVGDWDGLAERTASLADDDDLDAIPRMEAALVGTLLRAATGTRAPADADLRLLLDQTRTRGVADVGMNPAAVLARLWLAQGRTDDVLAVTDEPCGIVADKGVWIWATDLAPVRVEALLAAGRAAEAADLVAAYADGLRGRNVPAPLASLAQCQAILAEARGEHLRAADLYGRAAAAWQALPRPYDALLTGERRANCLSTAGETGAGLTLLAEVGHDLTVLGAHADAARIGQRLRELGLDARQEGRRGRRGYGDQLSPRELEVVRLVVTGQTNREIALELSRSPKTVAAQLNSAMRKLGVSSRTALAVSALEAGVLTEPGR